MNKEKVGGAIALVASLPLMMLALTTPIANAATVSSTVTAIDVCEWQMASAPPTLTLRSSGGELYEGAALSVSASISDLTVGLSGSQSGTAVEGPSTECSFYNNRETATVTFALTGTATFDATYGASNTEDTAMDFDLSAGNSLDVAADVTSCTNWTDTDIAFSALASATSLYTLADQFVENKYDGSASGSERCTPYITIGVDIPASAAVPAGAGQAYSFSGPSLEIALATTNVGGE